MRSLVRFALAAVAALSLVGCSDRDNPVEPFRAPPNVLFLPGPRGPKASPEDFVAITAGEDFTCARKMNGNLYCWGKDDHGQTGGGTSKKCWANVSCVTTPTQVFKSSGSALLVTQIDAGTAHACALESSGTAWCWGDGNQGQVGFMNGMTGDFPPNPVAGTLAFSSISAGWSSTCGVTSSSAIFCWGKIANQANAPTLFDNNSAFRFAQVTVGDVHVCALDILTTYGTPRCKGNNLNGQGGQASSAQIDFSRATTFGSQVSTIATNGYFTCVNQAAGTIPTVQCVGLNDFGELGNGQTGIASTGTAQTVGGGTLSLSNVATGWVHACALDPTNHAFCWGNGFWGQLGNGNSTGYTIDPNAQHAFSTPQPVSGGHTFRALAAGHQHTCGIGTDNFIYCWGSDMAGQLGKGNPNGGLATQPIQLSAIP